MLKLSRRDIHFVSCYLYRIFNFLKNPEGKGDVNMCQAIQQMREESKIEGAILMCKNLGVSLTDTIKQIAEMFHLSESESNETVKQYW